MSVVGWLAAVDGRASQAGLGFYDSLCVSSRSRSRSRSRLGVCVYSDVDIGELESLAHFVEHYLSSTLHYVWRFRYPQPDLVISPISLSISILH